MIKLFVLIIAILVILTWLERYAESLEVKAEPAKPVCIEAKLGLNRSEILVLCGKAVSYGQFI